MARSDSSGARDDFSRIAPGVLASIVAAVIFVALTARTGTTYHLFPVLIAFLATGLPRVLTELPIGRRDATFGSVLGVVVVVAAWRALELLDDMPSATLIAGQPGGVPGEFLLSGVLGALVGAWWGTRAG